jgi:type IV fimbrial biogenesis protein FimT
MQNLPVVPSAGLARQRGFTAIELMVTLAVLAVLAAIAAPSFTPLIERWRVRQATEDLQSTLYYARSEAIKRGGGVTIAAAAGGWADGWTVAGGGGTLQQTAAPTKVTVTQSASKTTLYVDRWGMLSESSGGAPTAMNILLYPAGKATTDVSAIRLCIAGGGRIAQVQHGAACPT